MEDQITRLDSWSTTVEGTTWSEIHRKARTEFRRFWDDVLLVGGKQLVYDIRVSAVTRDGQGTICSVRYEAHVSVEG